MPAAARRWQSAATAVAAVSFASCCCTSARVTGRLSGSGVFGCAATSRATCACTSASRNAFGGNSVACAGSGRRGRRIRHGIGAGAGAMPFGSDFGDGPQFRPKGFDLGLRRGRRLVGRETRRRLVRPFLRHIAVFDDPPDRSQYFFHRRFALSAACRCHCHIRRPCDRIRAASSPKTRDESTTPA